jgi:hypothetical protein
VRSLLWDWDLVRVGDLVGRVGDLVDVVEDFRGFVLVVVVSWRMALKDGSGIVSVLLGDVGESVSEVGGRRRMVLQCE